MKKIKILEVNNEDTIGRRFNGYDICDFFINSPIFSIKQLVLYKKSEKDFVETFTDKTRTNYISKLSELEELILSVHNQLSLTSNLLINNKLYKECDIIHFHMFHNTKLNIYNLIKIAKEKKIIISIHDPWWLSGRCVHSYDCTKWMEGCYNCEYLYTLFPMTQDNTESLWNLKNNVLSNIGATFLYPSEYIGDLAMKSAILKNENCEYLPFGIDTTFFRPLDKKLLRNKYGIEEKEIVISFRAQDEFKGTKYIVEALQKIETSRKIRIITVDQKNTLSLLGNKFNIIEMGLVDSKKLLEIYNLSDIFLSPSTGEAFGFMPVEAMACEVPVIVFDNTSLPKVTFSPECGIVAKNLDSIDLRNKIVYLIENEKDRINRGKLGRKLVLKNYSLSKYHNKLSDIYLKKYGETKKIINDNILNTHSTNKELIILRKKLRRIYKDLFFEKLNDDSFQEKRYVLYNKNIKINYNSIEVQKLISKFNMIIYERLKKAEQIKRNSLKTFINLLFYDRKKIIPTIKKKLRR